MSSSKSNGLPLKPSQKTPPNLFYFLLLHLNARDYISDRTGRRCFSDLNQLVTTLKKITKYLIGVMPFLINLFQRTSKKSSDYLTVAGIPEPNPIKNIFSSLVNLRPKIEPPDWLKLVMWLEALNANVWIPLLSYLDWNMFYKVGSFISQSTISILCIRMNVLPNCLEFKYSSTLSAWIKASVPTIIVLAWLSTL